DAAPTSWTRRFARKSAGAATASSRSARRVIGATLIARRRVARPSNISHCSDERPDDLREDVGPQVLVERTGGGDACEGLIDRSEYLSAQHVGGNDRQIDRNLKNLLQMSRPGIP